MSERKRTALGAPRKIRALLSSFIRYGGSDDKKSASDDSDSISSQDVPDASSPAKKGDTDGSKSSVTPRTARRSFRPLSSEDFFKRVDSFKIFSWFSKPSSLSPMQCARYGWENIDVDTLKCVSCKELFTAGLPAQWETEKYEATCKSVEESLTSAHSSICPWRAATSPESFLDIELANGKEVAETYCNRVTSMNGLGSRLPTLDLSSLKSDTCEPDTMWQPLQGLVRGSRLWSKIGDHEGSQEEEEQIWKTSCLLALLGWQESSSDVTQCPMLVCQCCRRRPGVWNFLAIGDNSADSTTEEEDDQGDSDEPQAKRLKRGAAKKSPFNPITEHRSWCSWVQPSVNQSSKEPISDCDSPATPTKDKSHDLGWHRLLAVLLKRADPDRHLGDKSLTPPSQAWKAVRKIMTFWQSSSVEDASEATEQESAV